MKEQDKSEVNRLEDLWSGEFGNAYTERNKDVAKNREPFWQMIFNKYSPKSVLEVGCNIGANLHWISRLTLPREVFGVDINQRALEQLRIQIPTINIIWSPARDLPFRDNLFDLVFTAGVLIHQPTSTLPQVMAEIVRCSRHHVLCIEYFSNETVEVPYRGQERALFKRNYGQIYKSQFPNLVVEEEGVLNQKDGWDDVTYWQFKKIAL